MGIAFATAITGRGDTHQTGVHAVLDVTHQNTIFNQHIFLTGMAFIVHIERATAIGNGAVVKHGNAFGGDTLANLAAEGARPLAVEVAF